MPKIKANNITMNYDQQGTGEPLILIPYLAADHACYAFQVAEYAKHFTCFSLDLRGTGETDKPGGEYSTELLADDVAAFMQAAGIRRRMSQGFRLARQQACGWQLSILTKFSRSLCTAAGPRRTPL
jgi:3-oxoadipate enol-lactonase